MKVHVALSAALFGLLFFAVSAEAEIYECDGKWTNLPCDGAIEKTLPESSSIARAEADASEEEEEKVAEEAPADSQALEPLAPRYSIVRKLKRPAATFT